MLGAKRSSLRSGRQASRSGRRVLRRQMGAAEKRRRPPAGPEVSDRSVAMETGGVPRVLGRWDAPARTRWSNASRLWISPEELRVANANGWGADRVVRRDEVVEVRIVRRATSSAIEIRTSESRRWRRLCFILSTSGATVPDALLRAGWMPSEQPSGGRPDAFFEVLSYDRPEAPDVSGGSVDLADLPARPWVLGALTSGRPCDDPGVAYTDCVDDVVGDMTVGEWLVDRQPADAAAPPECVDLP